MDGAHSEMGREPAKAALADHGGRVTAGAGRSTLLEQVRLIQGVRVRLAGDAALQHDAERMTLSLSMTQCPA